MVTVGRTPPPTRAVTPLAPLLRGLATEGEAEDLVGTQRLGAGEPADHRLHQRGGLARARAGEDQQRTSAVRHDLALLGVEVGGAHRQRRGPVELETGDVDGTCRGCCSRGTGGAAGGGHEVDPITDHPHPGAAPRPGSGSVQPGPGALDGRRSPAAGQRGGSSSGHQRARAMSMRVPPAVSGVRSARWRRSASASCPAGGEPSERSTRCHGTPEPNRAVDGSDRPCSPGPEGRGDVAVGHHAPPGDPLHEVEDLLRERGGEAHHGLGALRPGPRRGRRHARHPARLRAARGRGCDDLPVSEAPLSYDDEDDGTVVIEGGVIPRRVRRPVDLLRMALALVAAVAIVVVSYFLNSTSAGIDQDLTNAGPDLPALIMLVLNFVAGLGVLALPSRQASTSSPGAADASSSKRSARCSRRRSSRSRSRR